MKPLPRFLALSAALLAASAQASDDKTPAPPEKPAPAATVSAAGTWHLEIETAQGKGTPTFTFRQDGENLTGHYQGLFGEAPVTGTLKGAAITFSVKVQAQGQDMTISYSGTIEGDTMKGKVGFGNAGEGAFTGKRSAD